MRRAQDVLSQMPDWQLLGCGDSVRSAPEQLQSLRPDIVACDLQLFDGSATRLASQMQQWPQRPQLLLLTPNADDPDLFDALRAGAGGYCVDAEGSQSLRSGLEQLSDGRAPMSPRIAQQLLTAFGLPRTSLLDAEDVAGGQDLTPLSNRLGRGLFRNEHHLLSLLSHGWLSAEIGQRWRIGQSNVERRVWRLYTKLHLLYRQPELA